ncbi:hypothetical protein NXS19_014085 [Fusarium pseudograminearum]|nr:hypothetical protein NXS19_014085 [Fusarium pseudograminearum]
MTRLCRKSRHFKSRNNNRAYDEPIGNEAIPTCRIELPKTRSLQGPLLYRELSIKHSRAYDEPMAMKLFDLQDRTAQTRGLQGYLLQWELRYSNS